MQDRQRPLSRPPESIHPGSAIAGKYVLESMLGSGAMGTVWVATHVNLGSKVAVKLVSGDFAKSEEARARFLAEAKAAAALRSRYVVQMFDSGVTDGTPYIVMEYLKGESLEERLHRSGRLPTPQVVRIIGQVAKGLERAHSKHIVHRDLKPANIFLASTEDGEEVAKILDFGIAKMDHEDNDYKATATGVIMGTPLYMSPEQARGLKTLDHTSDLYSLGMVTYTALVGDVPFHAESFGDLVYTLCTQELPPTSEVAPWLPATLDAWFRQACHKDPQKRFQTANELYQSLLLAAQVTGSKVPVSSLQDNTLTLSTPSASGSPVALSRSNPYQDEQLRSGATMAYASSDSGSGPWQQGQTGGRSNTAPLLVPGAGTQQSPGAQHAGQLAASGLAASGQLAAIEQNASHAGVLVGAASPAKTGSRLPLLLGGVVMLAAASGVGLWWFTSQGDGSAAASAAVGAPTATPPTANPPAAEPPAGTSAAGGAIGASPEVRGDAPAAATQSAAAAGQGAPQGAGSEVTTDPAAEQADPALAPASSSASAPPSGAGTDGDPTRAKASNKTRPAAKARPKPAQAHADEPKPAAQPAAPQPATQPAGPARPSGVDLGF